MSIIKHCQFCKKEMKYSPLTEMDDFGIDVFFCHTCYAEFLYWDSGDQAACSIYVVINNKTYRWSKGEDSAMLWHIGSPGVPGVTINKNMKVIKSFGKNDRIPDVNPSNARDKISMILTFV